MEKNKVSTKYYSPFFAIRHPTLSLENLFDFYETSRNMTESDLLKLLIQKFNNQFLLEALYLATPVLYRELLKILDDTNKKYDETRLSKSLLKYYIRASSRCTPFGLFSSCGLGSIVDKVDSSLIYGTLLKRHLRLDMDFLCSLGKELSIQQDVKEQLTYYPNSSLFKFKNGFRYVEYRLDRLGHRTHHLVNLDADTILKSVVRLSRNGIRLDELKKLLLEKYDVPQDDIKTYLDSLLEGKILESSLQPNVTGKEYLKVIIDVLEKLPNRTQYISEALTKLIEVDCKISKISETTSDVFEYKEVVTKLESFNLPLKEERLFQLDSIDSTRTYEVSVGLVNQISDAVEVISAFANANPNTRLESFKRAFKDRYEDRLVNLGEALDSEIGIGYKSAISAHGQSTSKSIGNSDFERFRTYKFHNFLKNSDKIINVTNDEIEKFFPSRDQKLPESFSALINVYCNQHDKRLTEILIISPSTTNLLGRFCHADPLLMKKVIELTEFEAKQAHGEILAEIAHLPQSRIGNVLSRPHLREYEIEYLAQSTLPLRKRLKVEDLFIQMQNDKIILFSKSLKTKVTPKLSSAHNFSYNSLPVYNFLGDLQGQDSLHLEPWNWGNLNSESYLPRVQYKDVILSPARWIVKQTSIFNGKPDWNNFSQLFSVFKSNASLPNIVIYAESDHKLLLDLSNPACILIIKDLIRKSGIIILIETNWDKKDSKGLIDFNNNRYTNEIVIPYIKRSFQNDTNSPKANVKLPKIERSFMPGSEWVYFKVYSNLSADKIVVKLNGFAKKNKLCLKKWFFIRYTDPKPHLRIRFQVTSRNNIEPIIRNFYDHFRYEIENGKISRIVLDTYEREIERYGENRMIRSETMFWINSELVSNILEASSKNIINIDLVVIKLVDQLLNLFGYNSDRKLQFTKKMFNAFSREFNYQQNKQLKGNLQDLFRTQTNIINDVLAAPTSKVTQGIKNINRYIKNIQICVNELILDDTAEIPESYIASQLHMFVNRTYDKDQRFKELTIYYLMFRFYSSNIQKRYAR